MVQERRQFPRITPRVPLAISMGESNPGLLLDLCKGGVSLASLEPRSLDEVISLTFELPKGNGRIHADGEVAWTRDCGHLTGVRFLDLADASRRQLEEWISSHTTSERAGAVIPSEKAGHERTARAGEGLSQPVAVEQKDYEEAVQPSSADLNQPDLKPDWNKSELILTEPLRANSSPRYPTRIFLAVMFLSWALVFLGYRMGSSEMGPQIKEGTTTVNASESNPTAPQLSADRSVSSPPSLHAVPWSQRGLVLQVGAMKQESNADALASALQKQNFPAFVFQRGPGQLFRVAVGPYSVAEAKAAARVKDDLQKHGLKAIVKPWLPEP